MNTLSLASINSNSPYEVKKRSDETFSFITDSFIEIFVSFEKDDILQTGLSYQFGISNPKGSKSLLMSTHQQGQMSYAQRKSVRKGVRC